MTSSTTKKLCLAILSIVLVIASIEPLHYPSYAMHQIGTVIMLWFLLTHDNRYNVSTLSYVGYIIFLILHVFASHYLYSYVPYDEWLLSWFGFGLNDYFGFQRNMFDRVVHFGYGFLLYPFIFEWIKHWTKPLTIKHWHILSVGFVMASSMIYELIEWIIAIVMSPTMAHHYNGQQGDVWDAHQDMAIASMGSIIAMSFISIYYIYTQRFNHPINHPSHSSNHEG